MSDIEKEVRELCERHLHCANLYINISNMHDIELTFVECTTGNQIIFECKRVHFYNITRDFDDSNGYFVGEVTVSLQTIGSTLATTGWTFSERDLDDRAWVIEIQGGVSIRIVCLEFTWNEE